MIEASGTGREEPTRGILHPGDTGARTGTAACGSEARIPDPGIVIPAFGIKVPTLGTAVPSFGIVIPALGIKVPAFGIVIPGLGIVIPVVGIAVPSLGIEVPALGIAIPGFGIVDPQAIQCLLASGISFLSARSESSAQ